MAAQASIEYYIVLAVVIVIAGFAIYYLQSQGSNFPVLSLGAQAEDNEIVITVDAGSIPAGDWEYSVSSVQGEFNWQVGNRELAPPSVSLGEYAPGTYYVSLKHIPSGYSYFVEKTVLIQ